MSPRVRPPRCADCGDKRHPFPWPIQGGGIVWLCGPCAYKADHPEAPPAPAMPWEQRPLPLQAERLF